MADNVNVLDVLDDAAKQLSDGSTACAYDDGKELREARARIAELIAAANGLKFHVPKAVTPEMIVHFERRQIIVVDKEPLFRLAVALCACTGGGSNG